MSNRNMHNITDQEVRAELVLSNHGGVQDKNLIKIVNNNLNNDNDDDDDDDDAEIDTMSYSP